METNILLKTYVFAEIRDGLAIIRDGWSQSNTQVFAEMRDGLAITRDGWRPIFSLKIRDGWRPIFSLKA